MVTRPKIFLDTSAPFAGIWSDQGGARMLLRLGEAGAVCLLVSAQVVAEIERVLRRKAPPLLGIVAVLLDRAGIEVVAGPGEKRLRGCQRLVGHLGDATVLAAAWDAGADYFVTLDQKHFLDNRKLQTRAPFPVGTPGDCLAWIRDGLV